MAEINRAKGESLPALAASVIDKDEQSERSRVISISAESARDNACGFAARILTEVHLSRFLVRRVSASVVTYASIVRKDEESPC